MTPQAARIATGGIVLVLSLVAIVGCSDIGTPVASTAQIDDVPGQVTFLFFYTRP